MNNLSFFLLGLVLIYIPACLSQNNDKQCFSQSLKPSYPCCQGNNVVYTDKDGDWGVENGKWCGIGNGSSEDSCFSIALGYRCCKECKVVYTDEDGDWGVESGKWCGIKDSCSSDTDIEEEPVQGNPDFDFSFMKMENKKENMMYSPLSIKYALKMLQEGANNNTYTEINNVIGNAKTTKYSSIDKVMSLANGLFIRDEFFEYVKAEYINKLKEEYDAEIKQDKFINAQNANKWIEEKTLGIIKNMLKDEMFNDPELVMLIINALAVDVEWASPFSIYGTYGEPFYKDNGDEIEATTMSKTEVHNRDIEYYKNEDITVLSMNLKDYNGTQFRFMAIMPQENLSAYVENITTEQVNEIEKNLISSASEMDGVNLRIPKFQFDYDLNLKDDLMNLGIKDAFDPDLADFSKMSEESMHVSQALHKAKIEIAEKGVKAAAVTVIGMNAPTAARPREKFPVNVIIDKPFMFIIKDKNSDDIWFAGTVYEPNLWKDEKEYYELEKSK